MVKIYTNQIQDVIIGNYIKLNEEDSKKYKIIDIDYNKKFLTI